MATADGGGLVVLARVVKGVAIVVGGVCTFVTFASIVGVATGNEWVRAGLGLVLSVVLPAVAVDRALPKKDGGRPRPGLMGDVVAIVLLAVPLLFIGLGQPVTRPLLVREGDRLAESGHEIPAHAVYFLAGVRPVDETAPSAPPPASAPPATSASGG
jgi:hypothetical protein